MSRAFLLFVSLCAWATSAWAHSALVRTDPQDGATLSQIPFEIRMWFSEPIKAALSTIEVHDAAGKQVDRRDLRADAKEPSLVRLSLAGDLAPGSYKVSWSAVAQDMHVGRGSFRFTVQP
ncbi:MAG: copper resistance protein CopC [Chthoniobacterales bacterium]|nr:copper resistance protein CopC [Chthoniobacterales bacterium]